MRSLPSTSLPRADRRATGVLLVPPFGWDEQTSYRPRRDWSLALAEAGFANLRIDLPGTGDSSGTARDRGLVEGWTAAVDCGVAQLRGAGARRVAVIALGAGGLITLQAMAGGTRVDDLILWGVPASGRALLREIKAFGRLEQSQTGEPPDDMPAGELRAGGHVLDPGTAAALGELDGAELARIGSPARALLLGRDGMGQDGALAGGLANGRRGCPRRPGTGWGAALARPQSASPWPFSRPSTCGSPRPPKQEPGLLSLAAESAAEFGEPGARVRETPIVFDGGGQQLYAVLAEPVDAPLAGRTMILFNAGAIRRIGPNRMWTEAARRWAAAGIPVLRVDVEGIGDASGDSGQYLDTDDTFYTEALVSQSCAALDLAVERGMPDRFLLGGLCSGAFWAFQLAVADPRVSDVIALNPRMLMFERNVEGGRDLRKLRRMVTPRGVRNLLLEKQKVKRLSRLAAFVVQMPLHRGSSRTAKDELDQALRTMRARGQRLHMAFSGDEPLSRELCQLADQSKVADIGIEFHDLPYTSHTLKPLSAQVAAHAVIDEVVERALGAPVRRSCAV